MTNYELWQLEKYGNILPQDLLNEEYENGIFEADKELEKINHQVELELLKHDYYESPNF